MSNNPYAAFFAAYKSSVGRGNPLTREEVISDFTGGKTESLKELTDAELRELTIRLNHEVDIAAQRRQVAEKTQNEKADRMRKAIIAIFYKMNKKPQDAKAWAEKQGVGGVKKEFNEYSNQELYTLIIVAEKVLKDYQTAIRRAFTR